MLGRDAALAAAAALGLPLLLVLAGQAPLLRSLYPAGVFAAAGLLFRRRSPWYVGLCILAFAFAPLLRRIADLEAGFEPSSTVLLAPYLPCLWSGLSALAYCATPGRRHVGSFLLVLGGIAYGLGVAALEERLLPGLLDALKWTVGPLLALHLLQTPDRRGATWRVAVLTFVGAGVVMSVYGVVQYVAPAAWDLDWVANVRLTGMDTAGVPEPYGIRVFGTMNSAGSLGAFLAVAAVLALTLPLPLALPCLLAFLPGIALCQYRAVWAGVVLSLLVAAVLGPAAARLRLAAAAAAVLLGLASLSVVPEIAETLEARLRTVTELGSDASGEERLAQYRLFLAEGRDALAGSGFGQNNGASLLASNGAATQGIIDGGILEAYTYLGIIVGSGFFLGLAILFGRVCRAGRLAPGPAFAYPAIVLGTLAQLPFGSIHTGEMGLGLWIMAGLALAAAPRG